MSLVWSSSKSQILWLICFFASAGTLLQKELSKWMTWSHRAVKRTVNAGHVDFLSITFSSDFFAKWFLCKLIMMMATVMMVGAILNICLSRSSYLVSLAPPNSPIAPAYHHSSITSLSICNCIFVYAFALRIFIRPESDCCLALSFTHSLTHSCLVDLIDMTLVCEDAN